MSRYIEDLNPIVKEKAKEWLSLCKKNGLDLIIIQTTRTISEQNSLYAKGRTTSGSIITNAKGGYSYHNYALALDFCPLVNGKCAWDRTDLFTKAGQLAKQIGFEWGGDFKSIKDMPHIQMTFGLSISDLLNGKKPPIKLEQTQLPTYLTLTLNDINCPIYDYKNLNGKYYVGLRDLLVQLGYKNIVGDVVNVSVKATK